MANSLKPLSEWTLAEAAGVMRADLADRWRSRNFGPISTDSRAVGTGEFFLAIKGESFDGHAYAAQAAEKGAAGLIVRRDFSLPGEETVPVLRVDDTLYAYGELAREQRRRWGGPVIAISGSVGKTTTRRILARALAAKEKVLEPIRNFNNLIGLPRTLLELAASHEIAVLELGMNQPGELARLAEIAAPTVAGLTRIGSAHIGMFRSQAELTEAKLSLFEGTAPGAPLVINAACENSKVARERFGGAHPIVTFRADGETRADCYIENVRSAPPIGYEFDLVTPSGRLAKLRIQHFGRHVIENAAAAAAFLVAAGRDPALIAEALASFSTEPYRGQVIQAGGATFILDCYNAAPDAMRSALATLEDLSGRDRLTLVLADMLELGPAAREIHESLLPLIRALGPVRLRVIGPEMTRLAETLKREGIDARGFASAEELIQAVRAEISAGDTVFFKGSHSFALEKVAAAVAPGGSLGESSAHAAPARPAALC